MPRTYCKALTKRTARPCKHRALISSDYCAYHTPLAGSAKPGENAQETQQTQESLLERLPQDVLFQNIVGKYLDCEDLAVLACTSKSLVRLLEKPMRCLHTPIELLKALMIRDARFLLELVKKYDYKAHASIHHRSPPGAPGLTISLIADIRTPAICFHLYSYLYQRMVSAEMWTGTPSDTQRCIDSIEKHAFVPRELRRLRGTHVFYIEPGIRLYCNREVVDHMPSPFTDSDYQTLERLRHPPSYGSKKWMWPTRPDPLSYNLT